MGPLSARGWRFGPDSTKAYRLVIIAGVQSAVMARLCRHVSALSWFCSVFRLAVHLSSFFLAHETSLGMFLGLVIAFYRDCDHIHFNLAWMGPNLFEIRALGVEWRPFLDSAYVRM